jgi:acetolactate synthase-1/2/3 large subunit
LVESLHDLGVRHVFGVPSGGMIDYMDAIRRVGGMKYVLASHETGAGFMADVCARLTGAPGVCFGTLGPGATNLASGVGSALLDRSPVIAFTDELPAEWRGRTAQMGIDHQALFRPLTKMTTRLEQGAVKRTVFEAAALARAERPGPVHIGLPWGLAREPAAAESMSAPSLAARPGPDRRALARLAGLFREARRPLLAVGLGAVRAGVREAIAALAERHRLPVVLTPMAKGMLGEDHPCYAGVLFHALSDRVGETHGQTDLVIAIGYDPVEFNYESWLPEAPLAVIDTVAADVDRDRYTVAVELIGDIARALEGLAALPDGVKGWDFDALAARRRALFGRFRPAGDRLGPCAVLEILREVLPAEGIMSCDVGAHTHLIGQQWRTPAPGLQIMTNGWSAMGFGIPAAIAAKLCRPEIPVCAVVGDGGLLMSAGELATAVREQLAVVFVVLCDADLALIRIKQEKKGYPIYGTALGGSATFTAESLFGIPVMSARDPDRFRSALASAFASAGPAIIEAVIDSREYDDLVLKQDRP